MMKSIDESTLTLAETFRNEIATRGGTSVLSDCRLLVIEDGLETTYPVTFMFGSFYVVIPIEEEV